MNNSAVIERNIALKLIEFSKSPVYNGEKNIVYRLDGRKKLTAARELGHLPEITFTLISRKNQIGEISIKKENIVKLERFKKIAA